MANYGIKIDLLKLKGSFVTNLKGKTILNQLNKNCEVMKDIQLFNCFDEVINQTINNKSVNTYKINGYDNI